MDTHVLTVTRAVMMVGVMSVQLHVCTTVKSVKSTIQTLQ